MNEDFGFDNQDETVIILLSTGDRDSSSSKKQFSWCIDNGIEFLCINEADEINWNKKKSLLEEAEGWDRVTEALSTTPWPNIETKNSEMKSIASTELNKRKENNNEDQIEGRKFFLF